MVKLPEKSLAALKEESGEGAELRMGKSTSDAKNSGLEKVDFGEIDPRFLEYVRKFVDDENYNIEEKLMLNRIAFLNFKKRGGLTKYTHFYRHVKTMEEGTFENKLFVFFEMVDEDDD